VRRLLDNYGGGLVGISAEALEKNEYRRLVNAGCAGRWSGVQGIIVTIAAMFIVAPPKGWLPKTWKQPSFYLIYIMMTLVAFGGLVVTSQLKEIAGFYKVDKVIVAWGLSASIWRSS
jgi:hypothetical protein